MVGAFLLRTPPPALPCMGGRVRGRERMQEEGRGGPTPALPAGREEEEGRGWVNRWRFFGGRVED